MDSNFVQVVDVKERVLNDGMSDDTPDA